MQSVIADTYSFALLFALGVFNHHILNGTWVYDLVIVILWFVKLSNAKSKQIVEIRTREEALEMIEELKKQFIN